MESQRSASKLSYPDIPMDQEVSIASTLSAACSVLREGDYLGLLQDKHLLAVMRMISERKLSVEPFKK